MTEQLRERRRLWLVLVVAVVGGVLLGAVDLVAQRELPYPWANLANSSAVWAVGAFGIGVWVGDRGWRPVLAGTLLLLVAVESYYLTAALVQGDSMTNLVSPTAALWLVFGVLAGVVFGAAGGWSRGGNRWRRVLGAALPGAVLLAEAAVLVLRSGNGGVAYRTDSLQTAAIEAVLGLLLPLLVGRTGRERLEALAASVPLALIGLGGFLAAGFGG
ncbi:DUF6518 family protein [Micromonospora sp. WMMD882]|uniref:DUF6518 family protein n=1 Tax=Micromonospora sp. WMMD882 TaxID=3015151 RepID=UPI00248C9849|nr:DUF6518 family protein [Micromonospora sp. WMMD882]WBB81600.1 DUF6518 family protein [Micromonospora sp. WMMD882]